MSRVSRSDFGTLSDGTAVTAIDLAAEGIELELISYGAAMRVLRVPDREGTLDDVTLAYDALAPYEARLQYFGASVGRFANRIAGGTFEIDGVVHDVGRNDGPNCLHGGPTGFAGQNWQVVETGDTPHPSVVFAHVSPDGEGGFPGRLEVRARYELTGPSELTLSYEAETDRPTVVNLTNHTYFNLAGVLRSGDILGHRLTVAADAFLPTDATSIPTGEVRKVEGTPFDFGEPREFGARIRHASDMQILRGRGYDQCFVLRNGGSRAPSFAARVEDDATGRVLELFTTAPGLQVYSGNFLDGTTAG